jgi:hypothetical protein
VVSARAISARAPADGRVTGQSGPTDATRVILTMASGQTATGGGAELLSRHADPPGRSATGDPAEYTRRAPVEHDFDVTCVTRLPRVLAPVVGS